MRISKSAPNLLKKAATSVKSKSDALRTKLIFLASLRRRLAMISAMSRQIHGLAKLKGQEKQARVEHGSKALTVHKAMATSKEPVGDHGGRDGNVGMFEVAMFEEGYHGYPDWTNSLFDDDNCYKDEEDGHDNENDNEELDVLGALDEPSVIEIIRSNREAQGLEFNMDDEIDEACDMFIRRCRSQMNLSLL
ncbi:hypothetical protein SEVIR_2G280800v4 [Setaria viridis]|uniref:Uncharacterized protein n=3 Tax=Setaria TaxID=4554 RepID=A0A368Q337_SETIT|nr:uncharacterized protein LOC101783302 [Setaria italica]XP_034580957.1 uncharacterized protein LOC117844337 [Setaria viridis]RCV12441.1 hypothetical protein SETIT_2G270000v2 [Setaria italica]TKW34068.1 hypothetical protein SEVIR_2G280800v2 [Setaria viridis]